MVEDTAIQRRNLAQRIREAEARGQRKGLAQRIRESGGETRAMLMASGEKLTSSSLVHPVEPQEEKTPTTASPPAPSEEPDAKSDQAGIRGAGHQATDEQTGAVVGVSNAMTTESKATTEETGIAADRPGVEETTGTLWERVSTWVKKSASGMTSYVRHALKPDDGTASGGLVLRAFGSLKLSNIKGKILSPFSSDSHHIHYSDGEALKSMIRRKYRYAEVHRLREKLTHELHEKGQKTLVITSPHDGTGNTFLAAVLAINAASFSEMEVLIVDTNMRWLDLHKAFDLDQSRGFTDVIKGILPWEEVIKPTEFDQLKVMTAGEYDNELARHLSGPKIEALVDQLKEAFDFVVFDTSPVLRENRNNVDPSLLSTICDELILTVQGKKTTKAELEEAYAAITQAGGDVDGVVYNRLF